jgi:Holliday junction resolvase-like predicted endonuclease
MKGRRNVLTGQLGEFLACAELNRRGYVVTPFSKNVPEIDLLVFDENLRVIPVQVKAFTQAGIAGTVTQYMDVRITEDRRQLVTRKKLITNPNLIYLFIKIGPKYGEDEFFLLRKKEVCEIQYQDYKGWLKKHGNRRPNKPDSLHCALWKKHLEPSRDNWGIFNGDLLSS